MLNHKKGKKMTTKEIRYGAQMSHNIFIMKQLDNLGIKRKYLGYYFLLDILTGIINQTSRVQSFSRQIYKINILSFTYYKKQCIMFLRKHL